MNELDGSLGKTSRPEVRGIAALLAESDIFWESAQRGFEAAFGRVKSEALREAMTFLVSGEFVMAFQKTTFTSKAQLP